MTTPSNKNSPRGLVPIQRFGSASFRGSSGSLYYIPAGAGSAIGVGDPVVKTGAADAQGIAAVSIAQAGAGDQLTGAVVGFLGACVAGSAAGSGAASLFGLPPGPVFRPANATLDYYAFVEDDPMAEFVIQENDDFGGVVGTPLPVAAVGSNANLVAGALNAFGQSGWMLNANGVAVTQNFQLKIKGFLQAPHHFPGGLNAKVIVQINQHTEATNTAGV